ncbi:MAG TPA: hypothetical protein VNA65_03325 [Candidatus Dormibacteraeota bacterium]|nr:hypothetical protein [Candidatus Dormibacteraeota bacterium]
MALTQRPLLIAVALSLAALGFLVWMLLTLNQPGAAAGLAILGFVIFTAASAAAWILVYAGWVLGVEVTYFGFRFGALRKADQRAKRGLPPQTDARPYATWLYEYRAPISAVKRVWLVSKADVLNPERAYPALFGGSRAVPKQGWIRTPFARGGLLLQVDLAMSSMPVFGSMQKLFARVPASGLMQKPDLWYTPVANPERCRDALAEALRTNGFELDAEGEVHEIPGVQRPQPAPPPAPAVRRHGPRHGSRSVVLSLLWTAIPVLTLGYFTWAVYGYAAIRVRQLHTTLIAVAWLMMEAAYWWVTSTLGARTSPYGALYAGLMALLALGGTFFAFFMRREVFYEY